MYTSQIQVESDAALARAFQEEEYRAGRAPKPPPLRPEYPGYPVAEELPNQHGQPSHFEDWTGVLQDQAETLRERVERVQAAHRAEQASAQRRERDLQLAQGLQAQELGLGRNPGANASQVPPSQQKDLELARGLQAQELEAAQTSGAPVDWSVLEKLSPSPSSQEPEAGSEVSQGAEGLKGLSFARSDLSSSSVGPGTPVASEVVPPDGFFDGIRTDPKIVPIVSPEEFDEGVSHSSRSTQFAEDLDGFPEAGPSGQEAFGTNLDGVGAKLRHMKSIPHVLRTNSFVPTWDEKQSVADHELLVDRLTAYGLAEQHVAGDGNCQFHALSDQLYRTPDKHKHVRKAVIEQLKHHPQYYEAYISDEDYRHYVKRMSKDGEWGDHITLQAAADRYGLKISLLTTFKDNGFIQIDPRETKSQRVLYLSFWAEVHYNSIYPTAELPPPEPPKHKNPLQKFIHNVLL